MQLGNSKSNERIDQTTAGSMDRSTNRSKHTVIQEYSALSQTNHSNGEIHFSICYNSTVHSGTDQQQWQKVET